MSICQLQTNMKSFLVTTMTGFFLFGCSTPKPVEQKVDNRVIQANWLKLPLRFADHDMDDNPITHPFFDLDPLLQTKSNQFTTRFFVATPVDSGFEYDIDLYSGHLYQERAYCPQNDVWEFYKGEIDRPNFTQGIVPRIYDETNSPQKIIIISKKESVQAFKYHPTHYDDARIVGSMILDRCESFPCDRTEKWHSAQILVGVSPADESLRGVTTLSALKNSLDWNYVKAMLVNKEGTFNFSGKEFPATRISRELNALDTKNYFDKHSTIVNMQKLEEWRVGCMKLYDSMWETSEKIRAQKNGQADDFLNFFKEFYAKDSDQFYGCQKLVRPANINENHRRLWFFAHIQAFTLLEKNGFFYNCHDNAWAYNPKVDDEKYFNNQNVELARCRSKDFQKSFDQAINGMSLMKNQTNQNFRFVEYDNIHGGSHQKIYGWIPGRSTKFTCVGDKKKQDAPMDEIFPHDVIWEHFKIDEDRTIR
jgi:hypothetical protein